MGIWGRLEKRRRFCSVGNVGDAELLACVGTQVSAGLVMVATRLKADRSVAHKCFCASLCAVCDPGKRGACLVCVCAKAWSPCKAPRAAPSRARFLHISIPLAPSSAGTKPPRFRRCGAEFCIVSQHLDNRLFLIMCLAEAPLTCVRHEATGASLLPCKQLLSHLSRLKAGVVAREMRPINSAGSGSASCLAGIEAAATACPCAQGGCCRVPHGRVQGCLERR